MFQKILVAIDDSESSRSIFDRSLLLAKVGRFSKGEAIALGVSLRSARANGTLPPTELMIIHVLTMINDFYPSNTFIGIPASAMRIYAEQLEVREQAGIEKLQSLAVEATTAGIPTDFVQKIGDPGKVICETATDWNANLIVVGRRGLNGLSELLMGSTSNYVLHHAPCAVLTIQNTVQTLPQPELSKT